MRVGSNRSATWTPSQATSRQGSAGGGVCVCVVTVYTAGRARHPHRNTHIGSALSYPNMESGPSRWKRPLKPDTSRNSQSPGLEIPSHCPCCTESGTSSRS